MLTLIVLIVLGTFAVLIARKLFWFILILPTWIFSSEFRKLIKMTPEEQDNWQKERDLEHKEFLDRHYGVIRPQDP